MRNRIRFLVNLRNETTTDEFRRAVQPVGWLLPPAYAGPRSRKFAALEASRGVYVLADNGLFDDISRLASMHEEAAADVVSEIQALRQSQLGAIRRHDVNAALRIRARTIARAVDPADSLFSGHLKRSRDLASLETTAIVGAEDPELPVSFLLGIGPEAIGYTVYEWRRVARRIADAARSDMSELPPTVAYLPVASPQDAVSARCFAEEFARANIESAAIAFGAFMANQSYGSTILIGRREVFLPAPVPLSYIEAVVALREFLCAYRDRAGKSIKHLHLLGLGSPIVIGLAALLAADVPHLSLDATSPLRDASFGKLYSNQPALMKLDPGRVAARILRDRRMSGWSCRCLSCRQFHTQFPQDAEAARAAWRLAGMPTELNGQLAEGHPLGDALPLLSTNVRAGARGRAARAARVGHNHWSITRMCVALSKHVQNGTIGNYMVDVVQTYCRRALPPFAAAVQWSLDYASTD